MSREIKFRAWIAKPINDTYTDRYDGPHDAPIMYYQEDQYLGSFLRRANFMAAEKEHDSYAEGKVELLQYTCLKDKKGKEIYEGDVVRWGDHCKYCQERPVRVAEVKIDPDLYFASQVQHDFHYGNFIYSAKNGSNRLEHVEVVGNIYENPELLQEAKS